MNGLKALDLPSEERSCDGTWIKRRILRSADCLTLVTEYEHGAVSYEPINWNNIAEFIEFCRRMSG